jgi:hypothetical protein
MREGISNGSSSRAEFELVLTLTFSGHRTNMKKREKLQIYSDENNFISGKNIIYTKNIILAKNQPRLG